ncbi:MAG: DNA replication/repair protein RecF, partial [Alphaproteobacteria bacterium]
MRAANSSAVPRPDSSSPVSTAAAPALAVRRLTLTDFRGYAGLRLETDASCVVLTGANGAGKTNLLEALSMLAPGRGLRGARLAEMDRVGADGAAGGCWASAGSWAVAATVTTPTGPVEIGTGREPATPEGRRERRIVRIDGAPVRGQAALARALGVVWLTPDMDRLFRSAAVGRRRFVDRLVAAFDPDHVGRLAAYSHNLRERARLLRDGGADKSWLAALEEGMARHGIATAAARRAMVARLDQTCGIGIGPFPAAALALDGAVESWLDEGPALSAEDRLRAALADSRARDAETGGAAIGPHRSDLRVTHLTRGLPAAQCSTGEQKALLIALVLAHARLEALDRGAAPLLLLDEIAAHLDE